MKKDIPQKISITFFVPIIMIHVIVILIQMMTMKTIKSRTQKA